MNVIPFGFCGIRSVQCIVVTWMIWLFLGVPLWAKESASKSPQLLPGSILTLDSVFEVLEEGHPLLKRTKANMVIASGKLLKALGKFEPKIVNDWELERLVKDGATKNVGFNDTFIELRHPWGIKGFAGFRAGIGDVEVADLGINTTNQPLLGIVIPLLRGFIHNPDNAELKKSSMADQQVELEIQQTRQDLYLGAATQYWNWVAASKIREIQEKAVSVAEERQSLLANQADSGARARFDVTDARQEVQSRKVQLIKDKRKVEEEQFKLALFLWKEEDLITPEKQKAPDFPPANPSQVLATFEQDKNNAITERPEVKQVMLQAEFNHIDLEVAENSLLPDLRLEAEPTRKPGEFVLGLGYRFGAQISFPFLQREARGNMLQVKGETERLRMLQQYRKQKINMDVANARSSITRSREKIDVLQKAVDYAIELENGERTRFELGATSLLIVNIRERNVLKAKKDWIKAMAEYQKSLALYQWATGKWAKSPKNELELER